MNQIYFYNAIDDLLEGIANELDVPQSRYEAAERAYKSVGDWLHRPQSRLNNTDPQVYVQGSFRLGTVIKPITEADDYDLDIVSELNVSKLIVTQEQVKDALGAELLDYCTAKNMNNHPESKKRCWTLEYADGAQFHMDILPALPDSEDLQQLLRQNGIYNQYAETSLAITDTRHPRYQTICVDWLRSNPKGFSQWFVDRMGKIFVERQRQLAYQLHASVEDIPVYRVKTPLQKAIQILKRHRDIKFRDKKDLKPISIILTTLAAHAYDQEQNVRDALFSILQGMDEYIEVRHGIKWIANPSDPLENFADRWREKPQLEIAFLEWLDEARRDFSYASALANEQAAVDFLTQKLGQVVSKAQNSRPRPSLGILQTAGQKLVSIFSVAHRQQPRWPVDLHGTVSITEAHYEIKGWRPKNFQSNGDPLPKNASLRFRAQTNIQHPFKVFWQVVNTGGEAERANGLRGGFEERYLEKGGLTKTESTLYTGKHWIECFIVKDGRLVARSGEYIVNIA